ncbi:MULTISPECIES: DUF2804 domain-containing protein [Brevibacillus]|uniref:DUF2804 domain-containing protein n=1 Tax=Brevibacillus TaxID=55080 RepID=UPI000D10D27E|nr:MULTISPECIES: DUF2804 domain-containing protein [Brevibacillus]MED1945770.1 DUF2804 domain-containing protein [Brevibacillus formosus]MED2000596.1 DUF2804 domain-containing protein [Brevibacillus formosus]MED2084557.1 DUF2804 domain-containing protein [Brevibacillus formosus]PSK15573.1 DUF2804 domain-containing protein [Brevibacillus sp. NRRL NRS-603]
MPLIEKELTQPLSLCDQNGRLLPEAVGWSRYPLHDCQFSRHWLRRKKWNFWFITAPECAMSIAMVNLDYAGIVFVHFIDLTTGETADNAVTVPFGAGIRLGAAVDEPCHFASRKLSVSFLPKASGTSVEATAICPGDKHLSLNIVIDPPAESLNVVIPWSAERFQFTSKQAARPVHGTIAYNGKSYLLDRQNAFASLDFGRGVWPYHTRWNWTTCSFRHAEGVAGFNFGRGWTDGTGMTENGLMIDGVLYKLSEQIRFTYDPDNRMLPWTLASEESSAVRLTFTPLFIRTEHKNFVLVRTTLHQVIGRYDGTLSTPDGKIITVQSKIGICEEQNARW